jgi:hypothetical protein
MRKMLRWLNDRMRARGWIALGFLVAVAAVGLPAALKSRFVSQRRAAFSLKGAQTDVASHQFEQARTEFRAALRLRPDDAVARRALAEMDLGLGNTELAFLEYESLTDPAPNSHTQTTELAGGVYQIGPIVFDETGQWTVRFHLHEDCQDATDDSPHGHAAFFTAVP